VIDDPVGKSEGRDGTGLVPETVDIALQNKSELELGSFIE
jgi:hypothetical protein